MPDASSASSLSDFFRALVLGNSLTPCSQKSIKNNLIYLKSIGYFGARIYDVEYIKLRSDPEDVNAITR